MINATFETTPAFNAGIQGLIQKCRINAKTVVEKETGELIKMLVKLSPPKEPDRTKFNIETAVRSKMTLAASGGYRDFDATSGKVGASGIKWYSVDERLLRGVAPKNDMRKASPDAIYKVFRTLKKSGRAVMQFRHPRKRQKVMISQKIVVTKPQVTAVVNRVKKHVGRLKAGWLVAVASGAVRIFGANMPPQWVARHMQGARGNFVNELGIPDRPEFTIINQAKGIGNRKHNLGFIVNLALKARAKSMQSNALLFMRGKKNIADYSR